MGKMSKKQFAKWCTQRYQTAICDETKEFIVDIGELFLDKVEDVDDTPAEVKEIHYKKMYAIYEDFCCNTIRTGVKFDQVDAIKLREIIVDLRNYILNDNRNKNLWQEAYIVDQRIISAWQFILSKDFWFTLPDSVKLWTRCKNIAPKVVSPILSSINMKGKNPNTLKEMKKIKDNNDFLEMLKIGGM
jgi:hypothetical protein